MEFLRFNSSKFRTFAPVFIEHEFYNCSISLPNRDLERDFRANLIDIGAALHSADFNP